MQISFHESRTLKESYFLKVSLHQEFSVHCIFIRNGVGDGIGGGWLVYNRVWEGGQGVGIIL